MRACSPHHFFDPLFAAGRAQRKPRYPSCGQQDGLITLSQGVHRYFGKFDVPHVSNVDDHGHDGETCGGNPDYFVRQIFR